jgi:hypothetical protein
MQFGTQVFTTLDTGAIKGGEHIVSLLREQVGVVWYAVWKKVLQEQVHYCMNSDKIA